MSNGVTSTAASVLAAVIAAANVAFTAYVNTTFQERLEKTKSDLQQAVKESERRIEQQRVVAGIENDTYLKRLKDLQAAIEEYLTFSEHVTEGTVPEKSRDQQAEHLRIKVRLLTAACEARPGDPGLAAAAASLNSAVDLLRQSIIAETIDQDYGPRVSGVIDSWTKFQAEVFRVAAAGYDSGPKGQP